MTTYKWLSASDIADWVNPECRSKGWIEFNVNEETPTCRVLGAFEGPTLVGFFGFSLLPHLGPLWMDAEHRDGVASREMAQRMAEFMVEVRARGALMIAESPATARLADRYGLERVTDPVFIWKPNPNVAS